MRIFDTKVRIIAAVDAALLLLVVLGLALSPARSGARSKRADLLKGVDAVAAIRLGGGEALELVRDGVAWGLVDGGERLPVDASRVDAFLKAVDAVDSLEPVARDRSAWKGLGLEGDEARSVSLLDAEGKVLSSFTLGSYAQVGGQAYLAVGEGSAAYRAPGGMASYVRGSRSSWLDLRAFPQAPKVEEIQEFVVKGSVADADGKARAYDYTLRRSAQSWESSDGRRLDAAKVESAVRALSALRGTDYAAPGAPEPRALVAELRLGNGRSLSLSLGERGPDGRFAAASSQRGRQLYLSAWSIGEAVKSLDELAPAAAP